MLKAKVLRAIEYLKAKGEEISPFAVAQYIGVPMYHIYTDLNVLDQIYKYGKKPAGADQAIEKLIMDLKLHQKKIKKLSKELELSKLQIEKSFAEGFSKGAAVNYSNKKPESSLKQTKKSLTETWARGVLFLDHEEKLSVEKIKKSYRSLVACLHPDQSGKDTDCFVRKLREANDILLASLN